MSAVRRWSPAIVWGGMILVATSLPGSALPSTPVVPGADKLVHATLYGVLGWLVARAVEGRGQSAWAMVAIGVATFAAADEWHQQWIPGRSADAFDWVADVAGAMAGASLLRSAHGRRETRT